MAKFTTEVRTICENACGLSESVGFNSVSDVLKKSAPIIFNFDFPIFDENYRSVLEIKILKHFYTREIGFETVGLWKLKLDTKLNEIMPFYNQFYKSELIEFNPLYTHNLSRTHNNKNTSSLNQTENNGKNIDSSRTTASSLNSVNDTSDVNNSTSTGNVNNSNTNTNKNLFSATPQGALTNVENETYLTDARLINDSGNATSSSSDENKSVRDLTVVVDNSEKGSDDYVEKNVENKTLNNSINSLEEYIENVTGFDGTTGSELILKFRETFMNIDLLVIEELEPLFMQLW